MNLDLLTARIKTNGSWLLLMTVLVSCGYFLFSPLGFAPVPWPDAPPFFLPWRDLAQWPPTFRMHNYAAFVPSMEEANFGTMPGLTVVLGGLSSFGLMRLFSPTVALKLISMLALVGWAWCLSAWVLRGRAAAERWFVPWIFLFAALWDPTLRWVTIAVRPEPWLGLIWAVLLRYFWWISQGSNRFSNRSLWLISGALALSAYFHFAAIAFVPAVIVALIPAQKTRYLQVWLGRLIGVGVGTLIFLMPWLVYCIRNFPIFMEQIGAQFGRLNIDNPYFKYSFLSGLFVEMGSPVSLPKFFLIGKILLWALVFLMTFRLLFGLARELFEEEPLKKRPYAWSQVLLELSACTAFWSSFYLFYARPEAWFVSLPHFLFWPWLVLTWMGLGENEPIHVILRKALIQMTGGFAMISVIASLVQSQQMPPSYRWPVFNDWVDCIDHEIQANVRREHPKVWETYLPSVLVDLAVRHPGYDLTRTLDYHELSERAWAFALGTDAIILSRTVQDQPSASSPETFTRYFGLIRPWDEAVCASVPFGDRVLSELSPTQWNTKVCHYGGFWATVVTRKPLTSSPP